MSKIRANSIGNKDNTVDIEVKDLLIRADALENLGEYEQGIELNTLQQYITKDGLQYQAKSGQVPYVTSGDWETDHLFLTVYGAYDHHGLVNRDTENSHPAKAISYKGSNVGDTLETLEQYNTDLANPDKGAAMVARGVVAVDSIADLLALPEGQRKEGLWYLVKGCHAGSDIGGGQFFFDAALPRSNHNGGTIISTAASMPGDWDDIAQQEAWFDLSQSGTGCWVREPEAILDVACFGAKGDGITQDTAAIQRALIYGTISLAGRTYLVDPTYNHYGLASNLVGIRIPSDREILGQGGTLKADGVVSGEYNILLALDSENISIKSLTLEGDRDRHLGAGGEWGMGLTIAGSRHVTVQDVVSRDCWGDGVYVRCGTNPSVPSSNILLERVTGDNNRRQGLSIISVKGFRGIDCTFKNAGGVDPECGVDIEPNVPTDFMEDVYFKNLRTENNGNVGLFLYLKNLATAPFSHNVTIEIDGHTSLNDSSGFYTSDLPVPLSGSITVKDAYYKNSMYNGVFIRSWHADGPNFKFLDPVIVNHNRAQEASEGDGSAFAIISPGKDAATYPIGGVTIKNLRTITEPGVTPSPMQTVVYDRHGGLNDGGVRNVKVLDINNYTADYFQPYSDMDANSCVITIANGSRTSEVFLLPNRKIPAGGVVDSGTTATGRWVKFADGTLIQSVQGVYFHPVNQALGGMFTTPGGGNEWEYPIPFVGIPFVTTGVGSGGGQSNALFGGAANNISAIKAQIRLFSAAAVDDDVDISGYAVGRWY